MVNEFEFGNKFKIKVDRSTYIVELLGGEETIIWWSPQFTNRPRTDYSTGWTRREIIRKLEKGTWTIIPVEDFTNYKYPKEGLW